MSKLLKSFLSSSSDEEAIKEIEKTWDGIIWCGNLNNKKQQK